MGEGKDRVRQSGKDSKIEERERNTGERMYKIIIIQLFPDLSYE